MGGEAMTRADLIVCLVMGTLPVTTLLFELCRQVIKLNEGFTQFNKLFGGDSPFAPVDTPEGEKLREFKATPPTALYETDRARALAEGYDVGEG